MAKSLKDLVAAARDQITETSVTKLQAALQAGEDLLLVDVREPGEFSAGHIASALSIPRGIIEPAADLEFPNRNEQLSAARDRHVVLYCATGGRSALSAVALGQMGFTHVESLAGGIGAWNQNGGGLTTDA